MKQFFYFIFVSFISCNLFAWGHLKSLTDETGKFRLISILKEKNSISYCLFIDSHLNNEFTAESIQKQIAASLHMWLKPLSKNKLTTNSAIKFVPDCQSSEVNLLVHLGSDKVFPHLAAYTKFDKIYNNQPVMYLKINTDYTKHFNRAYRDFKNILSLKTLKELVGELSDLLQTDEAISVQNFATKKTLLYEDLYQTSFRVLLHETGHAFGLCDNITTPFADNCDPNFKTKKTEGSVMSDSTYLTLTSDDAEGIIQLFNRKLAGPN